MSDVKASTGLVSNANIKWLLQLDGFEDALEVFMFDHGCV